MLNLTDDLSYLGKVYKAKKAKFMFISVDHSMVDSYLEEGWEDYGHVLKTKTKLRKPKSHDVQFEDDIWCQFYELGYRNLNYNQNFYLYYGKSDEDKQQIDVVAVDADSVLLIECKSSEKMKKAKSFKTLFEALPLKLDGFRKAVEQIFGPGKRIKYIFATRNLRIEIDGPDMKRLEETKSFYYNDNSYMYVNSLIKNYKGAAKYQFLGIIFKNQLISSQKIEVPALEGFMGKKKYYMFSIEPHLLLKMGFVLHRTKANESEMPTYQRLLVPSRLKGITKFINDGGFFPNSIIVNFNQQRHKVEFQGAARKPSSNSRAGLLKIPNAYSIAYIIDGQHRVYGYANSEFKESNTIPVVAFTNLSSVEQLEIFMDINQNQKAVSPSLKLTLEEDLYWGAERADFRQKALKSSIVQELGSSQNSPLYNLIKIGEDLAKLSFKPFYTALTKSGLLPTVKGNKYDENTLNAGLYNVAQTDHSKAMAAAKKDIVGLLSRCYDYVMEDYPEIFYDDKSLITSNRGTFAFIVQIGSLNSFLTRNELVNFKTSSKDRFDALKPYLKHLLDQLKKVGEQEEEEIFWGSLGTGGDIKWLRRFQSIVNDEFPNYEPNELIDWKERQDESLQAKGREYGVEIEKHIKKHVLLTIEQLYGDNWELEINAIKRECQKRAEEEMERTYKQGLGKKEVKWTEMFNIYDYKTIIEKYWAKKPDDKIEGFRPFEVQFSFDSGEGLGSKAKSLKWISLFNSYRNLWAHEGTKEKRLNKEEVAFLEQVHRFFYPK